MSPAEIERLYQVKKRLIADLSCAPPLSELTALAGMHEPKLRKLFKQIFGRGMFDYYQFIRMKEAGRLLKENGRNVSEVGYDLGFTNLSHFSREFEKHMGTKPKKFQQQQD